MLLSRIHTNITLWFINITLLEAIGGILATETGTIVKIKNTQLREIVKKVYRGIRERKLCPHCDSINIRKRTRLHGYRCDTCAHVFGVPKTVSAGHGDWQVLKIKFGNKQSEPTSTNKPT